MSELHANGIALYVYRQSPDGSEFLQLHRSGDCGEYENTWQTVYGGIEEGETAVQAALRELREETGLAPVEFFQVEYLESFYYRLKDQIRIMPVFAARVEGVVQLNDEHDAWRWVSVREIASHFIWRSQRQALEIIQEEILAPGPAREALRVTLQRNK